MIAIASRLRTGWATLLAVGAVAHQVVAQSAGREVASGLAREGYVLTPDSVRLYYRVVGKGPETVFVSAALYHRRMLDALAKGRRLVLFDPRGRGRSDTVPVSKASLEHELRDLETLRQAAGVDSFALVGWSALGLEAFVYAARYPGRVTRLVMLAPLPPRKTPYWDQLLARRRTKVDSVAQAKLDAQVAAGEFKGRDVELCRASAKIGDRAAFGDTTYAHLQPDVCQSPNEWLPRYARHSRAMLGSYGDYDWRPSFPKVTIPVLVVHGDRDAFPLDGSREWVAGRSNARLLVFPGAGHWLQYERQKPLIAALDQFLSGRWPERAEALPGGSRTSLTPTSADSFVAVVANRVELDINAPASLVWSFLPSIRQRPRMERVPQNGLLDQFGARFDVIFRDSAGTITRHDRIEVLHWEPGVRYSAHVRYLPPGDPIDIIYNVDLRETAGITHMVMDSYATLKLPDPGTDAGRVAKVAADREVAQEGVVKGYQALKADIEAAATKR